MPQLAICDGLEILIARATSRKQRIIRRRDADWLGPLLFLGGRLFGTKAGVSTSGELGLELFDPTGGIDELQFARVKRVANIANVHAEFFSNAAGLKSIAATAGYFGFAVIGMDAVFHDF